MNKVAKGTRVEKICADELKAQGYTIWKTIRHRFLKVDLFGLFDVVALHPGGEHMLFIQCKSTRVENEVRERVRKLRLPASCQKWIWIRKPGKWVKEFYE